ncbi:MAG TPA: hypothetical protein VN947_14655 [Polyangia bacterium]|nr:hypothetical protein [Polyangia bacterium]
MVRRALVVAVLVLVAGCPHKRDSAPSPKVEPPPAPLTCRALQSCTDRCADAACAEACTRRLTAVARPVYDELQACVTPACANADAGTAPCREPASFGCKMCVLGHCAAQASRCMAN